MVANPEPHDTGVVAKEEREDGASEEQRVDPKHAALGEPIIGKEGVLLDEHGDGAVTPDVIPAPKGMTPTAWARHCITHLPYCSSCPWCVAAKRPNMPHRRSNESDSVIPLLVADY